MLVSLAYSRRSDSGVWLEVRESESRKELVRKRGRERKKETLSLPITHPPLFSCSHLLAQSPQSESLDHQAIIIIYYSFKIFPQFWLAKSTRIIHRNHLPMTKFGRILCLTRKWRQKCSPLQVKGPLTEKTWGRSWVVFFVLVLRISLELQLELGEIMAKNIAKTARRQLGGRHLLFGEYLRSWTKLNVNYRR